MGGEKAVRSEGWVGFWSQGESRVEESRRGEGLEMEEAECIGRVHRKQRSCAEMIFLGAHNEQEERGVDRPALRSPAGGVSMQMERREAMTAGAAAAAVFGGAAAANAIPLGTQIAGKGQVEQQTSLPLPSTSSVILIEGDPLLLLLHLSPADPWTFHAVSPILTSSPRSSCAPTSTLLRSPSSITVDATAPPR
eukprot:753155-Hanusia_phi.AAC.1